MDLKILSWNLRGLGQDEKIIAVRNEIRRNNVTICSIQKSKKEIVDDSLIRSLWGNIGCNYLHVPSAGASGGIIVMWNDGVVHMEDFLIGDFSLTIKFRNLSDNFEWFFTSVYGAFDYNDYSQYWQELNDIRILFNYPWVLGGDFNATLSHLNRNCIGGCSISRNFFTSFVSRHEVIDLPLSGGKFTWTNSQKPPILVRLDRFLVSDDGSPVALLLFSQD
ncbi:uncharacterized protein LOC113279961 [Papaver somniferum]|uniref:uncharacterized protein LOC113279961 n=1 Tax=Papaver somniferum TaxID=3469 RepID=UPI000E6FDEC4|nr:uncharacterized protein LOC113279961 [Papaver somniferum]